MKNHFRPECLAAPKPVFSRKNKVGTGPQSVSCKSFFKNQRVRCKTRSKRESHTTQQKGLRTKNPIRKSGEKKNLSQYVCLRGTKAKGEKKGRRGGKGKEPE